MAWTMGICSVSHRCLLHCHFVHSGTNLSKTITDCRDQDDSTSRFSIAPTYRTLDWENREFTGGETVILKPHVLDYWRSFQPGVGLEERHIIETVEPRFNRLTVFDPRFPHGVRMVQGTRDPLKGRLVSMVDVYHIVNSSFLFSVRLISPVNA